MEAAFPCPESAPADPGRGRIGGPEQHRVPLEHQGPGSVFPVVRSPVL